MENFTPTPYTLECVATGREFEDAGWMLADPQCKEPSLVRTKYARKQIDVKPADWGLYRFSDWMPVRRILKGSSAPVTYKSKGLAAHLGLENLWITFNGWYPAIGATMSTCSFKETEAYSVCGRAAADERRVLVVASAGNTARAFAKVCSDNNIRLLLSVPYDNIGALWFDQPLNPCVKLISCEKGGDYFDAIHLSDIALKSPGFYAEGGAKNVARRDAEIIDAKVLSNRRPPYSVTGGLFDALKATGGEVFVATNAMARKARKLFHELEGVDIYSAAGVALASLVNAVNAGKIEKDATVMLNVTGGGEEHFKEGKELWYLKPSHVFPLEPDENDVVEKVEALFN